MAIVLQTRPGEFQFAGNSIFYKLYSEDAAADTDIFFEYRVKFRVLDGVVDPAEFETLATLPFYPTDGVAKIDIASILNSRLQFLVPDLEVDEAKIYTTDKQTCRYFIEYREIKPDDLDPDWITDEDEQIRFAVKGGLSHLTHRGSNYFTNYHDSGAGLYRFLTWRQNNKQAQLTERMYLYYLNHLGYAMHSIRNVVDYTDGTQEVTFVAHVQGVYPGAVACVAAGATQLGLPALNPAKTILKWSVQVGKLNEFDEFTAATEEFTFYADNVKDYNQCGLNFRNSLGGLDSVTIRGIIEEHLSYDVQRAEVAMDPDYYTGYKITGPVKTISSEETLLYKGNTGWLEKEEQNRLRDMNIYREVWKAVDSKWWPVILTTGNIQKSHSDDQLWSMPVEFYFAGSERFYTPRIDLGN